MLFFAVSLLPVGWSEILHQSVSLSLTPWIFLLLWTNCIHLQCSSLSLESPSWQITNFQTPNQRPLWMLLELSEAASQSPVNTKKESFLSSVCRVWIFKNTTFDIGRRIGGCSQKWLWIQSCQLFRQPYCFATRETQTANVNKNQNVCQETGTSFFSLPHFPPPFHCLHGSL